MKHVERFCNCCLLVYIVFCNIQYSLVFFLTHNRPAPYHALSLYLCHNGHMSYLSVECNGSGV